MLTLGIVPIFPLPRTINRGDLHLAEIGFGIMVGWFNGNNHLDKKVKNKNIILHKHIPPHLTSFIFS